eukprot:scaffold25699_cov137-Cylindrotheca_fusiformis.AAC.12
MAPEMAKSNRDDKYSGELFGKARVFIFSCFDTMKWPSSVWSREIQQYLRKDDVWHAANSVVPCVGESGDQ